MDNAKTSFTAWVCTFPLPNIRKLKVSRDCGNSLMEINTVFSPNGAKYVLDGAFRKGSSSALR